MIMTMTGPDVIAMGHDDDDDNDNQEGQEDDKSIKVSG